MATFKLGMAKARGPSAAPSCKSWTGGLRKCLWSLQSIWVCIFHMPVLTLGHTRSVRQWEHWQSPNQLTATISKGSLCGMILIAWQCFVQNTVFFDPTAFRIWPDEGCGHDEGCNNTHIGWSSTWFEEFDLVFNLLARVRWVLRTSSSPMSSSN